MTSLEGLSLVRDRGTRIREIRRKLDAAERQGVGASRRMAEGWIDNTGGTRLGRT